MEEPTIVYEDEQVLVANKPVGWLTHETGRIEKEKSATVVDWFLNHVPAASGVGEPGQSQDGTILERSGIVHRLDRETSGILILAKTQDAHEHLKTQFHDRLVHKEYRAFVYGRVHDRWGTIDRAIGRSAKDPRKRTALPGAKGAMRKATTDFERIGTGEYKGETFSYLKLIPKTGRTHQLRVHLRALDRPIVGDTLYSNYKMKDSNNLDLERMALHAHMLELRLPNGEEDRFIAPVPQNFEEAAEKIAAE